MTPEQRRTLEWCREGIDMILDGAYQGDAASELLVRIIKHLGTVAAAAKESA
jgi:hypothetical protein